jgi:hypothetical protein
MIDDETIERFGRELDGLGLAEAAAQALEGNEVADAMASAELLVPF